MSVENYKLLIRNLRTKKNAKLKIQTVANNVKYRKKGKSVRIQEEQDPNYKQESE